MIEETLASERIYDGEIVRLRVDRVRLRNGRETTREVVEHGGAVAIVPVDAAGQVILVRQFRTPAGASLLEVPAGGIDTGEEPSAAAQRELQEETGHRAESLRRVTGFWVAPGYCTEFIHIFVAQELVESRLAADADEDIALERYPLEEALALIDTGEICDGKSIVGLLALARERAAVERRELTGRLDSAW